MFYHHPSGKLKGSSNIPIEIELPIGILIATTIAMLVIVFLMGALIGAIQDKRICQVPTGYTQITHSEYLLCETKQYHCIAFLKN